MGAKKNERNTRKNGFNTLALHPGQTADVTTGTRGLPDDLL